MNIYLRLARSITIAALIGLAGGCSVFSPQPDLSHSYVLNPLAEKISPAPPPDPTLSLGVYYTDLPVYLDRPQIVARLADNQPFPDEYQRWLEPLSEGFSRVLARDIEQMTDSSHVAAFPLPPAFGQEFEVYVSVTQFDGAPGGDVTLRTQWRISGPGGQPNYYTHESTFTRRVAPGRETAPAYVDTLSALVGDLAREVVKALPQAHAAKSASRP